MNCECDKSLPSVLLEVRSPDIAMAESEPGAEPTWHIFAERENSPSPLRRVEGARTQIHVDDSLVADVTIYPLTTESLTDGVQAVASAILWSALRAWRGGECG